MLSTEVKVHILWFWNDLAYSPKNVLIFNVPRQYQHKKRKSMWLYNEKNACKSDFDVLLVQKSWTAMYNVYGVITSPALQPQSSCSIKIEHVVDFISYRRSVTWSKTHQFVVCLTNYYNRWLLWAFSTRISHILNSSVNLLLDFRNAENEK